MRINIGQWNCEITLLKPSAVERDEMGGQKDRVYQEVLTIRGLERDKSQTFRQVIADYVNQDTRYYIVRDVREACDLQKGWRLKIGNDMFDVNSVTVLSDYRPVYLELEASKINKGVR